MVISDSVVREIRPNPDMFKSVIFDSIFKVDPFLTLIFNTLCDEEICLYLFNISHFKYNFRVYPFLYYL